MIQDLTRQAIKNAKGKLLKEIEQTHTKIEEIINNLLVDYFLGVNYPNQTIRKQKKEAIR
jgi:hypothetical protein